MWMVSAAASRRAGSANSARAWRAARAAASWAPKATNAAAHSTSAQTPGRSARVVPTAPAYRSGVAAPTFRWPTRQVALMIVVETAEVAVAAVVAAPML